MKTIADDKEKVDNLNQILDSDTVVAIVAPKLTEEERANLKERQWRFLEENPENWRGINKFAWEAYGRVGRGCVIIIDASLVPGSARGTMYYIPEPEVAQILEPDELRHVYSYDPRGEVLILFVTSIGFLLHKTTLGVAPPLWYILSEEKGESA